MNSSRKATEPLLPAPGDKWLRLETWTLIEGAMLVSDIDPQCHEMRDFRLKNSPDQRSTGHGPSQWTAERSFLMPPVSDRARAQAESASEILANARAAVLKRRLETSPGENVDPVDFVNWAHDRSYAIPKRLQVLLEDRRTRNDLLKLIAILEARIAQLEDSKTTTTAGLPKPNRAFKNTSHAEAGAAKGEVRRAHFITELKAGRYSAIRHAKRLANDLKLDRSVLDRATKRAAQQLAGEGIEVAKICELIPWVRPATVHGWISADR